VIFVRRSGDQFYCWLVFEDRPADHLKQQFFAERLWQEVLGDSEAFVVVMIAEAAGHDDDGYLPIAIKSLLHDLVAVDVRHVQVRDHEVWFFMIFADPIDGRWAAFARYDLEPGLLEHYGAKVEQLGVVVHYQYFLFHNFRDHRFLLIIDRDSLKERWTQCSR
jgi:hypothetical protein